jgi:large subunit ribosomal protein L20
MNGISYSKFMGKLNSSTVEINRKVLADLAMHDEAGFKAIFNQIMNG